MSEFIFSMITPFLAQEASSPVATELEQSWGSSQHFVQFKLADSWLTQYLQEADGADISILLSSKETSKPCSFSLLYMTFC